MDIEGVIRSKIRTAQDRLRHLDSKRIEAAFDGEEESKRLHLMLAEYHSILGERDPDGPVPDPVFFVSVGDGHPIIFEAIDAETRMVPTLSCAAAFYSGFLRGDTPAAEIIVGGSSLAAYLSKMLVDEEDTRDKSGWGVEDWRKHFTNELPLGIFREVLSGELARWLLDETLVSLGEDGFPPEHKAFR